MLDKELQEQNEKVASKDDFPINWIDRVSLFLSKKIKESFDPKNLLNPGKMYRGI